MGKKKDYFGFVLIFLLICFLMIIFFSNPHSFSKMEFNESFRDAQSDIKLDTTPDIIDYVEKRVMNLYSDTDRLKKNDQINSSQKEKIYETLDRASSSYGSYNSGFNEHDLYEALFYSQSSLVYYKAYPFIHCANEVFQTSKKYKSLFYYLSYSDQQRVLKILSKSENLANYLSSTSRYNEDKNFILNRAKEAFKLEENFKLYELKCNEFKEHLREDYRRQNAWIIFKWVMILFIFIIGVVVGITMRKIKEIGVKVESFSNNFLKFFNPKEVNDKTIERILRTSSVLAIFGVLGTAFITSNDLLVKILGFFAIIDVLILLASIVFGISALNNKSEKGKKLSFILYHWGIVGFILLVIFFFIMVSLGFIITGIRDSLSTFLNNQTAINK